MSSTTKLPAACAPEPKPTAADVAAHAAASYVRPARRLVAAGVKRGNGPLIVEQPQPADLTPAVAR
jgi:hypothetical protein